MLPGKKDLRRIDEVMDDDSDEKDTKRKSRNLSEKKRRDQFNLLVNELSSMVSSGGRKMDKSTVLKATISFLRNHNEISMRSRIHEIQEDWKPLFLTNEEFTHLVLEAVDGFMVVFSTCGQIYYISESITSLLGYLPNELLSSSIFDLVWEEEHTSIFNNLFNPAEEKGQVCFSCHLRRGRKNSIEESTYEFVDFVGYVRSDTDGVKDRSSHTNDYRTMVEIDATRLVFVGIGRVQAPQLIREMSIVDCNKNEFTSRHSLEWKFLFLDHRAPPIIGYLPFELLGTSGYDYYHVDDLDKVVSCHEALMQKGEGMSCYYRFLTKGQQWIWLQTRFYITYHQWNSKPEFIVCTHRVISYIDVLKYSRKEASGGSGGGCGEITMIGRNSPSASAASSSASATWGSKTTKRRYSQEEHVPSDCTSMSADSPASRLSGSLQQQVHSGSNNDQGNAVSVVSNPSSEYKVSSLQQQQQLQTSQLVESKVMKQQTFVEPPATRNVTYTSNITSIMQPEIDNFATPAVLSHLPVRPVEMSPAQSQLQADLQRKHAELQALIGQQQAELRRVSEQLLMARLGLLPVQGTINTPPHLQQQHQSTNNTISTVLQCAPDSGVAVSSGIPVPLHMQHVSQQQQVLISCSNSSAHSSQSSPPPPPPPPPLPPLPPPPSSSALHPAHLHHQPRHIHRHHNHQNNVSVSDSAAAAAVAPVGRFHRNLVLVSSCSHHGLSSSLSPSTTSTSPSSSTTLMETSLTNSQKTLTISTTNYPQPDSNSSASPSMK